MTSLTIKGTDWPVRYLEEELAARAAAGTFDLQKDLPLSRVPSSPVGMEKHPLELCAYEAHVLSAAAGHRELANELWEKASLGQVVWESSEMEKYPDRICPVCFELANLGATNTDCVNHHQVFYGASDLGTLEKRCFHDNDGEISRQIFRDVMEESSNFEEVREPLFSDDVVGRCLKAAAEDEDWVPLVETGEELRAYREHCDVDQGGDTGVWFYHPDPPAFLGKVEEMQDKMEERCRESGLEATTDYFG